MSERFSQSPSFEFGDLEDADQRAAVPAAVLNEVSGLYRCREQKDAAPLEGFELAGESAALAAKLEAAPNATEQDEIERLLSMVDSAALALPVQLNPIELRLDVDGRYPQMSASGTLETPAHTSVHWIARLTQHKPDSWYGRIWYTYPATPALPYTAVFIHATRSIYRAKRKASVTFVGRGAKPLTRKFAFQSRYFHPVSFEFDYETSSTPVLEIDTAAHPNRPASLPNEHLSLRTVYQRAGFDAKVSAGNAIVDDGADPNSTWSDAEMHDAMQTHWSRFADRPQWAMWVLFAREHDQGHSLGGVMFDEIGPNHRQGTAIFTDAFIADPPSGDLEPAAWVARMRFWTAAHEMGHAFNLAHAWQKTHPPEWGTPWIPTPNEPESRSFMNYPFIVQGGDSAFFADFEYRFSDSELLFMRHAPSQFVQMGNADWFDQHGFERSLSRTQPSLTFSLHVDRPRAVFKFLEPVVLELQLRNNGRAVTQVDNRALSGAVPMTVVVLRRGTRARSYVPYAHYCLQPTPTRLAPGEALRESLFVSAGINGWDVSEPGEYLIQAALHLPGGDVVSSPLRLRIANPETGDQEELAQDLFTEDVGRVLALDGSQRLSQANSALRELTERFPQHPAAKHARIALAIPYTRDYKLLSEEGKKIVTRPAKPDEARKEIQSALLSDKSEAAKTLGRVDYRYYARDLAEAFAELGDDETAVKLRAASGDTDATTQQAAE
jgi:hypothetical protein